MPSFQDSAFLVLLALLLFGPKGLAKLAREAGKLMGEFRRASNEFRLQMEDEFRVEEQAEQQKKIADMQAAAPPTAAFPAEEIAEPEHPHLPAGLIEAVPDELPSDPAPVAGEPIASSGELEMRPPATGLPSPRSSVGSIFDSVPHTSNPSETDHA